MTMRLLAATPENRTGATLTEVLMSMMILSIGVLSLAAMFPIGILSSVRATQLTHSVTLKNNVASQIDLDPGIVLDPDRNHNELNGTGFDYIIDPIGSLRLSDANSDGFVNPSDQNEWVRPFGWFDQNGDGQATQNEYICRRYHSGYNTTFSAETLASLPDSWTELAAGPPQASGFPDQHRVNIDATTDMTTVGTIALTNLQPGPQVPLRVMLVDPRDGQSHTSLINQVSGQTIKWNRQMPMTPAKAMQQVNEIRVQQQELKYSCLLTVRRENSGAAAVDVVVFLRRSFTLDDERPVGSSTGFVPGTQTVRVTIPVNSPVTYRTGGYILDATNLRWYQIAEVTELTATEREIALQQPITEFALPTNNPNGPNGRGAILMPHVVQVFHLGDL